MRSRRMTLTSEEVRADTERWLSKAMKFVRDPKTAYEGLVLSLRGEGVPASPVGQAGSEV